jgi:hypothetical protein
MNTESPASCFQNERYLTKECKNKKIYNYRIRIKTLPTSIPNILRFDTVSEIRASGLRIRIQLRLQILLFPTVAFQKPTK